MNLLRVTMGDLLDDVASKFSQKDALVDLSKGVRLTYGEFLSCVNQLAKGFIKLGLKKRDHLALWAPNRWEWIVTEFAATKIGVVLISVDTLHQREQLEYLLRHSDAKALVMAEGLKGDEYVGTIRKLLSMEEGDSQKPSASERFPALEHLILLSDQKLKGMLSWREVLEMGKGVPDEFLVEHQRSCHEEDVITLLYTSGTTGAPKGVMSRHVGLINTSVASAEIQRLSEKDRLCLSVPLSHMFGCICITLAGISKGSALIIPSETFDPGKVLEAIEREGCTAIYGSPSAFIALMEDPNYQPAHLKSLRTGIMGGAQCPMEVMKRVVEEMGAREIVIGYGLTETSSWITETRPDDPLELRVSTVGKPLPHVEVKIIDPQTGEETPLGKPGEVCARGFNMRGYYKMPAATEKAIDQEGWLHTGDLGTIDDQGNLRITGRLKEVIQKGTEVIYPIEIEEVLFTFPGISNVQIFGVPDKNLGEEVAAWIKPEEGKTLKEEEILRYCKEKLHPSQVPRYIKFVKEFPMTPLGKIQKFRMREITIREYGLEW